MVAPTLTRLLHWTARRSGAAMTITGRSERGGEVKIANVETIGAAGGQVIATDKDGEQYVLQV